VYRAPWVSRFDDFIRTTLSLTPSTPITYPIHTKHKPSEIWQILPSKGQYSFTLQISASVNPVLTMGTMISSCFLKKNYIHKYINKWTWGLLLIFFFSPYLMASGARTCARWCHFFSLNLFLSNNASTGK
jgi:hypothetical protein